MQYTKNKNLKFQRPSNRKVMFSDTRSLRNSKEYKYIRKQKPERFLTNVGLKKLYVKLECLKIDSFH